MKLLVACHACSDESDSTSYWRISLRRHGAGLGRSELEADQMFDVQLGISCDGMFTEKGESLE